AEKDLELRGPGDFFGTRQAGMPTLRMADLVRDQALLERARQAAEAWLTTPAGVSLDREAFEPAWVARFGLAGVG
ncbi:MAG: ATP-dependent DNA helicase RecG, partial [Vicinamibacteraceae bacterium]|nr:ATP-dependent DNA helicase RecG [Vicinamibacteraceae bacterium]